MLRNKILLFFTTLSSFAFSQEKKIDTVYVYEEIIVRDTVFIERPFSKIDKATFISDSSKKDKLELTHNGTIIQIPVDTLVLITNNKKTQTRKEKSWFFGGKFHMGLTNNSLFKKLDAPLNSGIGLGFWVRKQLFNSDFSVGIGMDGLYWMHPFSFDPQQQDSELNGYYFTENKQPKLFHGIDSKHFQFQIPLQLHYKIGRFIPSLGGFASISTYRAYFLGSSGASPIKFDKIQTFKAEALQIGYLAALEYILSEHVSVAMQFSFGNYHNLVFTNKDNKSESFKKASTFKESRGFLQLIYTL